MADIFPSYVIEDLTRQLVSAVTAASSPFDLTKQFQDWGGEIWRFQLSVSVRSSEFRRFEAFANSVLNKRLPFILQDSLVSNPGRTETITVNGGGQTGNQLVTVGWGSAGLEKGDFFSVQSGDQRFLHQLTEDCTPVAGGNTLVFVPRLRQTPVDGGPVEIAYPEISLHATGDVPTRIKTGLLVFSIDCEENP